MSSFSSVVQKPGKKIVPKAAPRRNVQRKTQPEPARAVTPSIPALSEEQIQEQNEIGLAVLPVTVSVGEANVEQAEPGSEPEARRSRSSTEPVSQTPDEDTVPRLNTIEKEVVLAPPEHSQEPRSEIVVQNSNEETADGIVEQPTITPIDTIVEETPTTNVVQQPSPDSIVTRPAEETPSETSPQQTSPSAPATRSKRQRGATAVNKSLESSRKRSRTVSRAAPDSTEPAEPTATTTRTAPGIHAQQPSTAEGPLSTVVENDSPSAEDTDDLFQSATRRLATVSELANSIESQTRSLRPRAVQNTNEANHISPETSDSVPAKNSNPRSTRNRRKKTFNEQAAEIIASAMGNGSAHSRDLTPDNAEEYELEPTKVTMGELCEDRKLGKKSALETEMEAHWPEIVQRRKEDRDRALANAEKRSRKGLGNSNSIILNQEPVAALAPVMTVVNGVIVVDQGSREIDRAAQLQLAAGQDLNDVREDRDYYKYVNQNTVGMKSGQGRVSSWDEESTGRFYKGLRMFGTDFLMIANMFPGYSRKQIKAKFIREENADKSRVLESLRNREPVELDDYAAMANKGSEDFQTLESLQKELDEQEAKLRDEDNERRKREGFVTTDKDNNGQPITSEGVTETTEGQTASAEPGRFDSAARDIVQAAMGSKKKGRKTNTANSKKGSKGGRRIEGGVEEVLGSIEDFGR